MTSSSYPVTAPNGQVYMSWDMVRVHRAIKRVFTEKVRAISLRDGSRYLVPSSSNPEEFYMVQADPLGGSVQCTCPAGEAGDPCKHGVLVLLLRRHLSVPHELASLVPRALVPLVKIDPEPEPSSAATDVPAEPIAAAAASSQRTLPQRRTA